MIPENINQELLIGFIDESTEALSLTGNLLLQLETGPADTERINAIFRPIHSLKGNSAYFGLMKIKKLAHSLENLLDSIRKGSQPVSKPLITTMLPCIDMLKIMMADVRVGNHELTDEIKYAKLIADIDAALGVSGTLPLQADGAEIRQLFEQLESKVTSGGHAIVEKLKNILSTIPALSGLQNSNSETLVQPAAAAASTPIDTLLTTLGTAAVVPIAPDVVEQIRTLIAQIKLETGDGADSKNIDEIADVVETFSRSDVGIDSLAISLLTDKVSALKTALQAPKPPTTNARIQSGDKSKGIAGTSPRPDKTMRISEQTLDDFLRCVGELLGIEEMLRNVLRLVAPDGSATILANNLKDAVNQFETISKELRDKIMTVRKVEAAILLSKAPRIIHDLSDQSGKKIEVNIVGEQLKIDKSYIDLLDAPFTHMVRNAVDHGIELPERRTAAGKEATGKITITIRENAESLQLIVEDDGSGLRYDKLQKKAESLGLIEKHRKLSEHDIVNLLFQSGVSTAETITDVSGRGVGMDVVKRAIDGAGGKIDVETVVGKGTRFTVTLPRNASTQIIDGYIVRAYSNELYVVPLSYVIEAFAIRREDIANVVGQGTILTRRGRTFPMYSLDALLDPATYSGGRHTAWNGIGIIVDNKGNTCILAVKEIVGIQKIVCKPVGTKMLDSDLFDGAAISGTGNVSMIINMEKLLP
jgi:two-component system, chemotaxis family, sensor kinase CheA